MVKVWYENYPSTWKSFFEKPSIVETLRIVHEQIKNLSYYPDPELILETFRRVGPEDVRVVIVGQDPYKDRRNAIGVPFAIPEDRYLTPTLLNIWRCLKVPVTEEDVDVKSLEQWSNEGVFLLNAALTVPTNYEERNHHDLWRGFTILLLNHMVENCKKLKVEIFWGELAKTLASDDVLLKPSSILMLSHCHPAERSERFHRCKNFVECNRYLVSKNLDAVSWIPGESREEATQKAIREYESRKKKGKTKILDDDDDNIETNADSDNDESEDD